MNQQQIINAEIEILKVRKTSNKKHQKLYLLKPNLLAIDILIELIKTTYTRYIKKSKTKSSSL